MKKSTSLISQITALKIKKSFSDALSDHAVWIANHKKSGNMVAFLRAPGASIAETTQAAADALGIDASYMSGVTFSRA